MGMPPKPDHPHHPATTILLHHGSFRGHGEPYYRLDCVFFFIFFFFFLFIFFFFIIIIFFFFFLLLLLDESDQFEYHE